MGAAVKSTCTLYIWREAFDHSYVGLRGKDEGQVGNKYLGFVPPTKGAENASPSYWLCTAVLPRVEFISARNALSCGV